MFRIVGEITNIEAIAIGQGIRELRRLRRAYGPARWRKLKGLARVQLSDGVVRVAELHRYEAHGMGRKELKLERFLGK